MQHTVSSHSLAKNNPDQKDLSSFGWHIFRPERIALFPRKSTEADAFLQLTLDIVQAHLQPRVPELSRFDTPGTDGTIHFSGIEANSHLIIGECRERKNIIETKTGIKFLTANLEEILELSDTAIGAACYDRFRIWRDNRVTEYIYCISCSCTDDEKDQLEKLLQKTFRQLAKDTGLSHLATLKITLFAWQHLKEWLEQNPALYQKWVNAKTPPVTETYTDEDDEESETESLPLDEPDLLPPTPRKKRNPRFTDYLENHPYISFQEYRLLHPDCTETEYRSDVAKKILEKKKAVIPLEDSFFTYPPSFALFLAYLQSKYKEKYPKKQVEETSDFGSWLNTRLLLSFPASDLLSQQRDCREARYLFPLMPASASVIRILPGTYHAIIANLIQYGWLQEEEENNFRTDNTISAFKGLRIIHPRIADEMLKYHLETANKEFSQEIQELFHFAVEHDSFPSCFTAFERISTWVAAKVAPSFFYTLFSDLIRLHRDRLSGAFMLTSLLTQEEKINLITQFRDFFANVITAEDFTPTLSELLHFFVLKKKNGELSEEIKENLHDILQLWFPAHPQLFKNYREENTIRLDILSTYLHLFGTTPLLWEGGPRLEEIVTQSVQHYSEDKACALVFVAWLKAGGDKEVVNQALDIWFHVYPDISEAGLVIQAWLKAGGHKETVKNALPIWLAMYPHLQEAGLVIQAWLEAGGDKEQVKNAVDIWLQHYPNLLEATFVLQLWLHVGGEKEILKNALEIWLKTFQNAIDSCYVIKAWLDAGGDKEYIRPAFELWLQQFPAEIETSFVIKAWLNAGGDTVGVKKIVETWLTLFPKVTQASFMIQAWLRAGGDKEEVKKAITIWLNCFPSVMDACFVLQAWLEAGGIPADVENPLVIWLFSFANTKQARFLLQAWFAAGGDKSIIRNALEKWLDIPGQKIEAKNIIILWLEAEGNPQAVKSSLVQWLDAFPLEVDTSFMIKAWLEAGGDPIFVKPYITPWLTRYPLLKEETSFVLNTWLNYGRMSQDVEPFVFLWLDNFYDCYEATYVIKAWLHCTNDLTPIKQNAFKWLSLFKDKKDADFVIKRISRTKDMPQQTLMDIIFWCQTYANYNEVLFKLSNLLRDHIQNPLVADQWLVDILSYWIARPTLRPKEIINLEIMMFNLLRNVTFAASPACIQLFIQWFLSRHSFSHMCLGPNFRFMQVPTTFNRYYNLLTDGKINPHDQVESVQKFLRWVSGWFIDVRKEIQPRTNFLTALLNKPKPKEKD